MKPSPRVVVRKLRNGTAGSNPFRSGEQSRIPDPVRGGAAKLVVVLTGESPVGRLLDHNACWLIDDARAAHFIPWLRPSNAPQQSVETRSIRVTHPYHPLFEQQFHDRLGMQRVDPAGAGRRLDYVEMTHFPVLGAGAGSAVGRARMLRRILGVHRR